MPPFLQFFFLSYSALAWTLQTSVANGDVFGSCISISSSETLLNVDAHGGEDDQSSAESWAAGATAAGAGAVTRLYTWNQSILYFQN